jgi:3-(3-hydroxy-phenyl)propionate hydroxylase
MLAGELALAGIDVALLERRPDQHLAGTRAGGLHARTIEVLDQRGIGDRFVTQGQTGPTTSFGWIPLSVADLPTRRSFVLALRQNEIERLLAEWVQELGVSIRYGAEVTGFTQDDNGVELILADGATLRAAYLVGCDGGRSLIRKLASIDFPGWDPTISNLLAEVQLAEEPEWGMRRDEHGLYGLSKMDDGVTVRVMLTERETMHEREPTLRDLSDRLIAVYGTDFGVHTPTWISRFNDMSRQAAAYRDRRVFLAGDAAHIHYPVGGQGLNTGVQDAVNLGWKLAQVIQGVSPERLLDTYPQERHPVAAKVLRNTMAQVALLRNDDRTSALRDVTAEFLESDETRTRYAAWATGLDIRYDLGDGHPLLGRRMPDLEMNVDGESVSLFSFLQDARFVLLDWDWFEDFDLSPWGTRVRRVNASISGPWELPVLGRVPRALAVLIRPDGYVAWVGDGSDTGLREALNTWIGEPIVA